MRVLVTGHLGYIGAVLTPFLLSKGHDVVGLDSDLYRRCNFGSEPVEVPNLDKDIRDVESADLRGFDAICHLAALSNDPLGDFDPELTYEINYKASVRLAEMAKDVGVPRFIFSSSCSNYGAAGQDMLNEKSSFNPVTPYGKSKVLVEKEVTSMASDSFTPVFLRNATAYGVSPRLRFDLVLNNLVAWAFTTGRILMKSDGSPWRPIVHIEDISRAFYAVMEAPADLVHNQAYNVGVTKDNLQIRDMAQIVGETVPDCQLDFADGTSPDVRNYRVNCDLLPQTLNEFRPQWNARRGAQELYDAFVKYDITLEKFEGPRYKRIAHVQYLLEKGFIDKTFRVQRSF
jgi:nucleoside-diphosphate-sugar epimerase